METILTLFGLTTISDHETIRKRLLEGLDIDTVDTGGRTLLMEAAVQKDQELASFLVEKGSDVEKRDRRGWSALHFAAQRNDPIIVDLLLRHRADANAQDVYGNSVLAEAVLSSRGSGDVIKLLLASGADATVENKSGISALTLANNIANYDVRQFFD